MVQPHKEREDDEEGIDLLSIPWVERKIKLFYYKYG